VSLWELVAAILTYNVLTFGNGPAMIPLLQENLVDRRQVLTIDQLLYAFAIARVTPGQANVYVASIGYMLFGLAGAILTTLAVQLPGYLMLPLAGSYERFRHSQAVKGFSRGLTSTSVGLIFAATLSIGLRSLTNPVAWIVFPLTLAMAYLLKWNSIVSLVVASAAGLVLHWLLM